MCDMISYIGTMTATTNLIRNDVYLNDGSLMHWYVYNLVDPLFIIVEFINSSFSLICWVCIYKGWIHFFPLFSLLLPCLYNFFVFGYFRMFLSSRCTFLNTSPSSISNYYIIFIHPWVLCFIFHFLFDLFL